MEASNTPPNTALVVEGGAVRCLYSNGILDGFLAADFNPFDLYIGVSAGASNLAAYLGNAPKRNLQIFSDYARRPEFINLWRFVRGGDLMDLDWLWEISKREIPFNVDALRKAAGTYLITVTDLETGNPVYLPGNQGDIFSKLLASSAIPVLYRNPPMVDGQQFVDGGVADPIPIKKALSTGATKVLVLRSRSFGYVKKQSLADRYVARQYKHSNNLKMAFLSRAGRYNESVNIIRNPPSGVEIIEICLPDDLKISRLSKDQQQVHTAYERGLDVAKSVIDAWQASKP